MYDSLSTYLNRTILSSQFLCWSRQLSKMFDCGSTYPNRTILSSQFLCWSRAIEQNVSLSIHPSQQNHIIMSISWVEAEELGKMYDCQSTYFKGTILSSQFLCWSRAIGQNVWLSIHLSQRNYIYQVNFLCWSRAVGQMYDFRSTYLKRTILSSQFLGLKQGNWAKCVTLDPPISTEPYYQVNFFVEAGHLGKMYYSRSTYLNRTILSSQFLGLKQGIWAKCVTVRST